jgi:cystathionine gamma-lyase
LAACEGGKYGLSFSSGCAAMTTVLHLLKPDEHLIVCDDVYGGTQRYMRNFTALKHSIKVDFVDLTDLELVEKSFTDKTRLVWIETPTNPTLKVIDIQAVVNIARQKRGKDCLVLCDNTFASMYLQRPLEFGCDISLHSVSKYIGGHSDVIMGALVVNDKELRDQLFFNSKSIGGTPSVFDCYLAVRGLKTLEVRMK